MIRANPGGGPPLRASADVLDWDGPAYGVICAFAFAGGAGRPLDPGPPDLSPPPAGWTWTHLRLGDVRAQAALKQCQHLPREALDLFLEGDALTPVT